ncbi:helix-turn-helix transcriptional regulator [Actinophytocola sp.]|uniref:helix-turn-helix transcriptional regulator n=1 Tax=Actinophytocola sp. TaxID=1872138 RepID=UPI002ED14EFD
MGSSGEAPDPTNASTPAEFIAKLRALRTWSGLTYRQMEGKAATYRDALPASTIATTLGRATLPRERFVDAFTRACGLGDDEVRTWLEVRTRIAMADPTQPEEEPPPSRPRWHGLARVAAIAAIGAAVGVAATLGIGALSGSEGSATQEPKYVELPAKPVGGLDMPVVGSWARIHPAGSPDLCLSQGYDRTDRYDTEIAAQMPCEEVPFPLVYLEPVAENVVQIQWHHPEFGVGCLAVMLDGVGQDMLEPRDKCADGDLTEQFRLEQDGEHFRLQPTVNYRCLGLRAPVDEAGAEVVQSPCSDAAEQRFAIELIKPPF